MLITLGAKRPQVEAMNPDAKEIIPGERPPLISPHCWQCQLPVERFTLDFISTPFYLSVQFQCHGRTGGTKIPAEEAVYKSRNGGVIWVFTESSARPISNPRLAYGRR